jgi:GAF domain-containing protein
MPVVVVRADGEQRHPRPGRGEEVGIGVGAAVVRHLQHVGAQVGAAMEEARLGRRAENASQNRRWELRRGSGVM